MEVTRSNAVRVVFGARHGLFKWPVVGRLMRALGTVPIFRASDSKDADDETLRARSSELMNVLEPEDLP
jgi:1-acyl-sn-glycerol-3-phosphate acyltransferase